MNEPLSPLESALSEFLTEEAHLESIALAPFEDLLPSPAERRARQVRRAAITGGAIALAVAAATTGILVLRDSDTRAARVEVAGGGHTSTGSTSPNGNTDTSSSSAAAPVGTDPNAKPTETSSSSTAAAATVAKEGEFIAAVIDDRVVILDRAGMVRATLGTSTPGDFQSIRYGSDVNTFFVVSGFGESCDGADPDMYGGTTVDLNKMFITKFDLRSRTGTPIATLPAGPGDTVSTDVDSGLYATTPGCDLSPTHVFDVVNKKERWCMPTDASQRPEIWGDPTTWSQFPELASETAGEGFSTDAGLCDRYRASKADSKRYAAEIGAGVQYSNGEFTDYFTEDATAQQPSGSVNGLTYMNVKQSQPSPDGSYFEVTNHAELVNADGTRTRITQDRHRVDVAFIRVGANLGVLDA